MVQRDRPLAGKVALITGAAKRLGRASALALADAGANVAITYRRSEREARRTLKELETTGSGKARAIAVRCDVTDENSVRAAIKATIQEFGGLDILVNNAGNYETVDFDRLTLSQWDAIFSSNVRGPFLVSRECLELLRAREGRIINMGSLGGLRAWATH